MAPNQLGLLLDSGAEILRAGVQNAVQFYVDHSRPFSSDDVWDALTPSIAESCTIRPGIIPGVLAGFAARGQIKETGFVRTRRPNGKRRKITLWEWVNG